MKKIEVKAYEFHELSTGTQEKLIKKFLDTTYDREVFWTEETIESIKETLEHFSYELKNYSFDYCYAANADFDLKTGHDDDVQELSGVRLWKYIMNNYSTYYNKYSKKRENLIGSSCPFTGYCADDDCLQPVIEFIKFPSNITFTELMQEVAQAGFKTIQNEYEYQTSEEYAREELSSRDTWYDAKGNEIDFLITA